MRQRRSTFVRMRDAAPRHRRRKRWATSFTRPHALVAFVAAPALAIGLAVGGFALPASADSDADGSGSQSQETQPPADAKAKSGASDEAKGSEDAGGDGASGNADSGDAGAGGSGSESAGGDAGNSGQSGQKGSSGDSGTQSGGSGSSDSTGTKKSEGSNSGGSDAGNSGSSGNSGSGDADESTSQKSNGSNGGSGDSSTGDSDKATSKDDTSKSADDEVIAPLAVTCTPDTSTACLSVEVTVVNAGGGTAVPTDWTFEAQRQERHWLLGFYWSNDDSSVYSLVSGDSKSVTEARGGDERYQISLNSGPSNYEQTSQSCSSGSTGDFDVRNNQTTTCSFTFTYEAPSTTTLHITKRGDRTGGGVTDGSPLGGATFEAYSTSSSWPNGPTGASLGTCTTDNSTGTCDITVENEDDGFWVVETSAPAGWHEVGSLGLGGSSATEYRFHVESGPDWRSNTVRDVPQDSDTSRLDDSDGWVNVRDNPAFPEKCGVSIALVFDTSGSISSSEMSSFKKAAKNFVGENALGGTPSTVTMLRFANTAQTMNGGASFNLSTESGWEDAQDEIDDLPNAGNGSTNWDHAMRLVKSTGNFDMVLFMTDGDPTQYGSSGSGGTGSSVQIANVEQAILSANAVKAEVGPGGSNTKIVGVGAGLGSDSDLNLAAISGPVAGEDYFLSSNFDTLASTLQDIATKNCGSTLTVVKQTVDAQGQVIDESADGWSMTASGANVDGSPSTQVTTNTGTNFELSFADGDSSGTVTVTETQKPGFSFDSAACQSGDDELPTSDPASGDGFVVDVGQGTIVTCVIVNKQAPASVTISKIWSVEDGDGTEIGSYSLPGDEGTLPSWMSAVPSIDATGTEWGAANDGFAPGQTVNIGESVDDDGTPPGCTLESQAVTAHNGETVDGAVPYGAKLTAGENTFTITNTVTCEQSLSLIKLVGYGDALPSEWTLSATPPTADDDAAAGPSGTYSDTTPVTAEVTPNIAYDLSEDGGPATYVSEGWVCVIDGTNTPAGGADGTVTVPLGENVTCTVTNVTASLTLFKHVDGDSNLEAGYWDLTATPGGSIAGLTPTTIDGIDGDASSPDAAATFDVRPGHTYTVSEALDAAHVGTPYRQLGLEKWDSASETWLPVTGDEVSVEAGEHAIYRLVNGSMPAFALPLTGGVGIDAIFLAGGLVLLLAAGLGLWQRRRTVRMSRP